MVLMVSHSVTVESQTYIYRSGFTLAMVHQLSGISTGLKALEHTTLCSSMWHTHDKRFKCIMNFIYSQTFTLHLFVTFAFSSASFLVGWLGEYAPLQHKNRLHRGQGLGWRFNSARLKMANDTVTSRPRCIFCSAMNQNGKG